MRLRLVMLQPNVQVTNRIRKSRANAALFVLVCVAIELYACSPKQAAISSEDQDKWREGDLVLRCGFGMESKVVTNRTRSAFSHIGILHYDSLNNEWQVIHAVPAEGEPEYLKIEPVMRFFSPERAERGAWLRVNCNDSIAREAAHYALGKVAEQVLFDNDYLLADSTKLYCTELVWRAYRKQGIDISGGRRHSVPTLFSKEGEGIFPYDIEKSATTLFVKPLKH
ncbi:MAG: hypothetical protein K6A36_00125 [Paludibacteraceae bacterium]|nr:hypothetical protein [Paludibacteraceae bacterium]